MNAVVVRHVDWPTLVGGPLDGETTQWPVNGNIIEMVVQVPGERLVQEGLGPPNDYRYATRFEVVHYAVDSVKFAAGGRILQVRAAAEATMSQQELAWQLLTRSFGLAEALR